MEELTNEDDGDENWLTILFDQCTNIKTFFNRIRYLNQKLARIIFTKISESVVN